MSHKNQLNEDEDNPFDLFDALGWHVTDQEDDDAEESDPDAPEPDDEICWLDWQLSASAFGDWGEFAEGVACDGSRDLSDEPDADEFSLFQHVRLVMDMRSAERSRQS